MKDGLESMNGAVNYTNVVSTKTPFPITLKAGAIMTEQSEELVDLNKLDGEDVNEESPDKKEEEPAFTVPKKFEGKSIEDIVSSYSELEKEFGRKSNEVGELRKLTDDFIRQQLDKQEEEISDNNTPPLTFDNLVDDPVGSIDKALESNPRIKQLEGQLLQSAREKSKLNFESQHPDWESIVNSEGFQKWVSDSRVRSDLFQKANTEYDYEIGGELFQLYKDTHNLNKEAAETDRKSKLKDAVTESGSSGSISKKIYRRADLLKLRMTDRDRYNSMQDEIMLAYKEGRVR